MDIGSGLPAFNIVGLPDAAVQEERWRVRAAIRNAGLEFPLRRVTVNLAPADVRKEGPIYDLPIAVAILVASGQIEDRFRGAVLLGELSLGGQLGHVNGVLLLVAKCAAAGIEVAVFPAEDLAEARMVEGVRPLGLSMLSRIAEDPASGPDEAVEAVDPPSLEAHDISVAQGQEHVKRALEVAASGGHNVMLQAPRSGETLLARALPALLPPLTPDEALDVAKIYSVGGVPARNQALVRERPFRAPHHTVSHADLVGGGTRIRPGGVSLAHRGVLFLDEFPEFRDRPRVAPRAARVRPRHDHARARLGDVPRLVPARRRHEPVSLQFLAAPRARRYAEWLACQ